MTTHRDRILEAAVRVYGEAGFRGATTRRIASEAGVNEVTLFRLFGSKASLIDEALKCARTETGLAASVLPPSPVNPESELTTWATSVLEHMHTSRAVIRTTMGELDEHPELAECACEGPRMAFENLHRYAAQLPRDPAVSESELRGAVAMLIGALFADAMGRDFMPKLYRQPPNRTAAGCVRFFLRAIGFAAAAPARRKRALRRPLPAARSR